MERTNERDQARNETSTLRGTGGRDGGGAAGSRFYIKKFPATAHDKFRRTFLSTANNNGNNTRILVARILYAHKNK